MGLKINALMLVRKGSTKKHQVEEAGFIYDPLWKAWFCSLEDSKSAQLVVVKIGGKLVRAYCEYLEFIQSNRWRVAKAHRILAQANDLIQINYQNYVERCAGTYNQKEENFFLDASLELRERVEKLDSENELLWIKELKEKRRMENG